MKLFGWMQNKLNGNKQVINNNKTTKPVVSSSSTTTHHVKQDSREEFSDWPHSLLAIGTFGNNEIRSSSPSSENQELKNIHQEEEEPEIQEPSSSPEDELQGFTEEEIGKLQKELTKLLSKKPIHNDNNYKNLPLDRFLNCPSSLEVDRRISNYTVKSDNIDENIINSEDEIERTISVILGRCKDIREIKNKKKTIGKKSISFLIKKMFVCSSGFAPQPTLRDTLQESRMEKLLRMMLQRKMNPQNTSKTSSMKKYLEDNKSVSYRKEKEEEKEKEKEKICDGSSKWVKTDSEYIVLEI